MLPAFPTVKLFTHDYIQSWVASPRTDGMGVEMGAPALLPTCPPPGTREMPCEAAAWRPYLLEVRVQLFQHHLQLVHLACQIQGRLLAAKAGGGVRISAHSWEEARVQAPFVPEALGSSLLAGVPWGAWGVKAVLHLGQAPHLVGRWSTRPEVSGGAPAEGPTVHFQEEFHLLPPGAAWYKAPSPHPPTQHRASPSTEPALGVCKWAREQEGLPGGQD